MIDENWTKFQYIKLQIEVKKEEIKQILCYIFIQYDLLNFIYEKYRQGEQILKKDRDRVKIENQRHLLSGVNETK